MAAAAIKLLFAKLTKPLETVVRDYRSVQMLCICADCILAVPQHDTSCLSRASTIHTLFTMF